MNLAEYKDNFSPVFALLLTLGEDKINFKPAEDKWSIHEIITHLADVEVQSHVRIRTILANKDPRMIYHDQMEWSVILEYSKVDLKESIEIIKLIRESNYNLLSRIPPEYFKKAGIHSTKGEMTLDYFVNSIVNHTYKHLSQIKNNLEHFKGTT
ncbi:MAG: DinB family protein [Ignavibacteriaceae bacterium]